MVCECDVEEFCNKLSNEPGVLDMVEKIWDGDDIDEKYVDYIGDMVRQRLYDKSDANDIDVSSMLIVLSSDYRCVNRLDSVFDDVINSGLPMSSKVAYEITGDCWTSNLIESLMLIDND